MAKIILINDPDGDALMRRLDPDWAELDDELCRQIMDDDPILDEIFGGTNNG